jgi:hypothetical protein
MHLPINCVKARSVRLVLSPAWSYIHIKTVAVAVVQLFRLRLQFSISCFVLRFFCEACSNHTQDCGDVIRRERCVERCAGVKLLLNPLHRLDTLVITIRNSPPSRCGLRLTESYTAFVLDVSKLVQISWRHYVCHGRCMNNNVISLQLIVHPSSILSPDVSLHSLYHLMLYAGPFLRQLYSWANNDDEKWSAHFYNSKRISP